MRQVGNRQLPTTAAELEKLAGLERNRPVAHTQEAIAKLTQKRLGRLWGRKRRPL